MVSASEFRQLKAKFKDIGCVELCELAARMAEDLEQLKAKHGVEHPVHKHKGGGKIVAEEA
jgi:hypothetical protein